MHITVIGSGREVGRSGVLVEQRGKTILLDYGVKIEPEPPQYPPRVRADAAILSHSHLDHCGALPLLIQKRKTPIYMTDVTLDIAGMLIHDSIKVSRKNHHPTPFTIHDAQHLLKSVKIARQKEQFQAGGSRCTLYHSGHIPGSSSVLVENEKRVLYTSDIQTIDTHLLTKCELPEGVDVLVVESTYAHRFHPNRAEEERRLVASVEDALAEEETILFPTFAVGRAQELLLILEKYRDLIALDGMAKTASAIIGQYPFYLRQSKKFQSLLRDIHIVETRKERSQVLKRYPIIVSSSGMLGGGPSVGYLRKLKDRPGSRVAFTGFLIDGTPGHGVLTAGMYQHDKERFPVQCMRQRFDLSAHADMKGLMEIVNHVEPKHVVCVHGDSCETFAAHITEATGIPASAPHNNERLAFADL